MALRSPYKSIQHHDTKHVNEYRKDDDGLTLTSVFPSNKDAFDNKQQSKDKNFSNQIKTINDLENNNNTINKSANNDSMRSISPDINKSLLNKENNELLSALSSHGLTNMNENNNRQTMSNITPLTVSKQIMDYHAEMNGSFVSHIPMMSSSSSSSSLSIPTPPLNQDMIEKSEPVIDRSTQVEGLSILI